MSSAYACRISLENQGAIASEKPCFDREEFLTWIKDHDGGGFFVRDEGSPWDCMYLADLVFHQLYLFELDTFTQDQIFHRIMRK